MFTTIVAFVMSHVTGGVVYVTEWDENAYGVHMNHNSYETTYEEWING